MFGFLIYFCFNWVCSSLVDIVERHVDGPGAPLDLADDVDHLVGVDPRLLLAPHGGGLKGQFEIFRIAS